MMRFTRFWDRRNDKSRASRQRLASRPSRRNVTTGLSLEQLEDRRLLTVIMPAPNSFADTDATFSGFVPTSFPVIVPTLRDAVIEANFLGGSNTIKLQAGTYTLSLQNTSDGTAAGTAIGHETLSSRAT